MNTLVINCGSSSIKYALFDAGEQVIDQGRVERLSSAADGVHREAVAALLERLGDREIGCVGHRVVHGGRAYSAPALIDDAVLAAIEAHIPEAPLHNPYALEAIRAISETLPTLLQVAVFDTAFHATMPASFREYAIDRQVADREGIRRYGFHGISHQYAAGVAATAIGRPLERLKLVTLHLGNGASACAVEFGRSIDTSMGNTPLEGLVMGTRSGDVDAGVLLGLMRKGYDVDQLEDLLVHQSGLKGLSGISNDLRDIEEAAAAGDASALLAISVFAHRARKYIGAYSATLGGLDGIVFTGGIGEHSHIMRRRILDGLEFLGVRLNEDANRHAKAGDDKPVIINELRSSVAVVVVAANEELMIAREVAAVAGASASVQSRGAQTTHATPNIPIAVSARHCHLTEATFKRLFGETATPTPLRELSQPGQFACEERLTLVGPSNRIERVRLLGPLRSVDQVEVSRTDALRLGSAPPIRNSGDVAGSAPITLIGPAGSVALEEGLIIAWRHIHMTPDDARRFAVADQDQVAVSVIGGDRDLVYGDVLIRVSDRYKLEMHIDTDEANAAGLTHAVLGELSATDLDEGLTLVPIDNAAVALRDD